MLNGKTITVVLPAYRAEKTLKQTYESIPLEIVNHVILVNDASTDSTVALAHELGIRTFCHHENLGYGANQKTCYREALALGSDIIVMLHPDYQYDPRLVTAMAAMVASGVYDAVLGSRILGNSALRGGMPFYKYVSNRVLTCFQNLLCGAKLSEYHSGYRAFSRDVIDRLPLLGNSDDFVFDNQMLTQVIAFKYRIGEISCPTKYTPEASSISFRRSVTYGLGVLRTSVKYRFWKMGVIRTHLFDERPTLKLRQDYYQHHDNSDASKQSDGSREIES